MVLEHLDLHSRSGRHGSQLELDVGDQTESAKAPGQQVEELAAEPAFLEQRRQRTEDASRQLGDVRAPGQRRGREVALDDHGLAIIFRPSIRRRPLCPRKLRSAKKIVLLRARRGHRTHGS